MMDFDKKAAALLRQAHTIRITDVSENASRIIFGENLAAALKEAYNAGLDESACAIDAESSRVLACQTKPRSDFDESVNLNLRMTTCLLPALADAVRSKKVP